MQQWFVGLSDNLTLGASRVPSDEGVHLRPTTCRSM